MFELLRNKVRKCFKLYAQIQWTLFFLQLLLHFALVYGACLIITGRVRYSTLFWGKLSLWRRFFWHNDNASVVFEVFTFAGIGTGVGSHRLFSHRSFKAKRSLKIFLIFCQTLSGQVKLMNLQFAFINECNFSSAFSIGWKLIGSTTNLLTLIATPPTFNEDFSSRMSDICSFHAITSVNKSGTELTSATSILTKTYCFNTGKIDRFQFSIWKNSLPICRHYFVLWMLLTIGMPTFVPYLFWNETLWVAYWMNLFRYCINFSHLGLSNTISHYYGARPYDNRISARDNDLMNIWTFGEGSHNFHHVFSRDYRTSEFEGWFVIVSFNLINYICFLCLRRSFNISTQFIHFFLKCGWIEDLKTTSHEIIASRAKKTGDSSWGKFCGWSFPLIHFSKIQK